MLEYTTISSIPDTDLAKMREAKLSRKTKTMLVTKLETLLQECEERSIGIVTAQCSDWYARLKYQHARQRAYRGMIGFFENYSAAPFDLDKETWEECMHLLDCANRLTQKNLEDARQHHSAS